VARNSSEKTKEHPDSEARAVQKEDATTQGDRFEKDPSYRETNPDRVSPDISRLGKKPVAIRKEIGVKRERETST